MNNTTVLKRLTRAGLTAEALTVSAEGTEDGAPVIRVNHDYTGLYPTREALQQHGAAVKIAAALGLRFEARGHYTATYIYL